MRVLLLAMKCLGGELGQNLGVHLAALGDAAHLGAGLVIFPEFSLTGSVDPSKLEHAIGLDAPRLSAPWSRLPRTWARFWGWPSVTPRPAWTGRGTLARMPGDLRVLRS